MAVTTVDSGSKALEFLGLLEDEQRSSGPPSLSSRSHQVDSYNFLSLLLISIEFFAWGCTNLSMDFWSSLLLQVVEVNLIITDYCMPGMTGYDLLKRVKVRVISFHGLWFDLASISGNFWGLWQATIHVFGNSWELALFHSLVNGQKFS